MFGQHLVGVIQINELQGSSDFLPDAQGNELRRIVAEWVVRREPGGSQVQFILLRFVKLPGNVDVVRIDRNGRLRARVENRGNERCEAARAFHKNGGRFCFTDEFLEMPRAGRAVMANRKIDAEGRKQRGEHTLEFGSEKWSAV